MIEKYKLELTAHQMQAVLHAVSLISIADGFDAFTALQTQVNEQVAAYDAANAKTKSVPGAPMSPTLKSV